MANTVEEYYNNYCVTWDHKNNGVFKVFSIITWQKWIL